MKLETLCLHAIKQVYSARMTTVIEEKKLTLDNRPTEIFLVTNK